MMEMEKKTYKCSKVGKTCYYAGKFGADFCCDYLVIEGHSRGCKPEECDKYIKKKRRYRKVRPEL